MAIIKTYPLKTTYFSQDRLVLSDMQPDSEGIVKGETKSLTLASLKNFIGSQVLDVSASTTDRYKGAFVSPSIGNVKVGIDLLPLKILLAPNGFDLLLVTDDPTGNPINKKTTVDNFFSSVGLITNSSINYTIKLPSTVGGASQVLQLPSVIGSSPHQLEWSTPAGTGTVIGSGTTNYIPKWNSSTELTDSIIYENGNNVGIGTSTPAFKLEVANNIGVSGTRPIRMNSATGAIDIRGSGTGGWANSYNFNGSSNTVLGGFGALGLGDTMSYFYVGSDYSNPTMVIKPNNGNVGIGTTAPAAKLDVINEARISYSPGNQYRVRITNSDGNGRILVDGDTSSLIFGTSESGLNATAIERMRIISSGNVGIGTTSPTSKLQVKGGNVTTPSDGTAFIANATSSFVANHPNEYGAYIGYADASNDAIAIQSARSSGATEVLSLNPYGGNVGIGITTPSEKLTVAGTIMSTATSNPTLILQDQTHSDITIKGDSGIFSVTNLNVGQNITMLYDGNVGIGTTSPASKLNVIGKSNTSSESVIKCGVSGMSNGITLIADSYTTNTSQVNFGVSYSGANAVMSRSVKVSNTADDTFLSSQNIYATRPNAFVLNRDGSFRFFNTNINATTAVGTAVTLNERMRINATGEITLRGDGTNDGKLRLNCSANSHYVEIVGPTHSGGSSYSLKLPNSLPSVSNQILESNALGILSWIPTPSGGGGGGGTVTSVGLSAPPAFSVGNSPITGSGSISLGVTGGTAGEFLAYNGQWATPPDTGTIVAGNPSTGASVVLNGIAIGSTVYSIPQGTGTGNIASVAGQNGLSGSGSSGNVVLDNIDRGSDQLFYSTIIPDNGGNVVASAGGSGVNSPLTLTGGTGMVTSGSTNKVTIALSQATSLLRGGLELGSDVALSSINVSGTNGTGINNRVYPLQLNNTGQAGVYVPWSSGASGISFSGTTSGGLATFTNSSTAGVSSKVTLNASGLIDLDADGVSAASIDFDPTGTRLKIGDFNAYGGIVELFTDGSRAFQVGVNGEIGLGTTASQGTIGQVLTSQGSGNAPTWSIAGGGNIANTNLTQTAARTYNMGQYPLTFTGTSTISMQQSNGLVANGNINTGGQVWSSKHSLGSKNTNFNIDWNNGNVQEVDLTNASSSNVVINLGGSNVKPGARYSLIVSRVGYENSYGTYSFNGAFWPGDVTPTNVSTGNNYWNLYEFVAAGPGLMGYAFRNYVTST